MDRGTVEWLIGIALELIGIALALALGWDKVRAWTHWLRRSHARELPPAPKMAIARLLTPSEAAINAATELVAAAPLLGLAASAQSGASLVLTTPARIM